MAAAAAVRCVGVAVGAVLRLEELCLDPELRASGWRKTVPAGVEEVAQCSTARGRLKKEEE